MATLVSRASGNFTNASTWGVVDSTSLLDSETANTALTTSYVTSSTFTPGAITIDRICIKIASRATGSPSNTISVALDQAGSTVSGTEVTINVADLDSCSTGVSPAIATCEGGWYAFKFASPVTLIGATAYSVKAKLSATTTTVNLYSSATTNWSRMLVTTTTAAPASTDILHIMGEHTGAGTGNSFTITMDNTTSTTFGAVANTLGAFTVGKRGTLTWGTSASTAYLLKVAGPLILYSGSTWNMGTSGTRMPSTSTATLQFVVSTNVDGGFIARNGATVNNYGNIVGTVSTLMTANKVAGNTVISLASTSGWANGDSIAFAPTKRTYSQYEKKTISTVDSTTQVTLSAGLTYDHDGVSPIQATVIHLTRNVKIIGTSDTLQAYVLYGNTAIVNDSYVEYSNMGSGTSNKRGVDILTTTGSYTSVGCVLRDGVVTNSYGYNINVSTANNITISYCNSYNINGGNFVVSQATSGTSITFDRCIGISSPNGHIFSISDVGVSLTNCTASGGSSFGFYIIESSAIITGTLSNLTSYTNGLYGFSIGAMWGGTISNVTAWRNGAEGISFSSGGCTSIIIDTAILFGNTTQNIRASQSCSNILLKNITCNGDSTFSTTNGILTSTHFSDIIVESSSFGVVSGIKTAHTQDINSQAIGNIRLRNCILASATEVLMTSAPPNAVVLSEKHDQTAGLHKRWERYGVACIDTTTYRTASPSEKLTPNSATVKFSSSPKQFAVASGTTATVTCYVYKDGSYNGNQPRLIVKANPAIGITSDTVLATASVGTGSWLTLSGTTTTVTDDGICECYVDIDGSAGSVFLDDWIVV